MLLGQPIRQIAYFTPDMRAAAKRHSELFGTGPFFVIDSLPLENCMHRGVERYLDHSACLAQWGDMMLEINQQNTPGPSYFHDLYPEGSGRCGFHHVAIIVDDLDGAIEAFARAGLDVAFSAEGVGTRFVMIDGIQRYGHFIELYPSSPGVRWIYDTVRESAGRFDAETLFRSLPAPSA